MCEKKNSRIYVETPDVDMMWMMEIMRAAILMCFVYCLRVDLLPCEGAYSAHSLSHTHLSNQKIMFVCLVKTLQRANVFSISNEIPKIAI